MPQPPVSVLFDPVTCMPRWIAKYTGLSTKVVSSGCKLDARGNIPCDPVAMAIAAGKVIGQPVSLEAYTLARYMQSEVGTRAVAERVAVAQDAINRARYTEPRLGGNINNLLLYRQPIGHVNRGFYGPIHGSSTTLSAPYGRWASTGADPTVANLLLAIAILNGEIPDDFNKGANDQNGPEVFVSKKGMAYALANVRSRATENRMYWVGPLPGVNHMRTMQYRTMRDVAPSSPLGVQLINRAIAAVQAGAPSWGHIPPCGIPVATGGGPAPSIPPGSGTMTPPVTASATTAISTTSRGVISSIVGAVLAVGGVIAAAFAIRSRR